MGKASSAKKVARAARAGGSRRAGQRRAVGFPVTIGAVVLLGLLLVLFARSERNANSRPRVNTGAAGISGDHWHVPFSIYTCVTDPSTPPSGTTTTTTTPETTTTTSESTTTTSTPDTTTTSTDAAASDTTTTTSTTTTTTTTAPATSTTIAAQGDVPGEFQPHPSDAFADELGIHTHGDGVMHVHPFAESVSGRRATVDKFLSQVGARITDDTLTLPSPDGGELVFKEGTTKCKDGRDAIVQIARWDTAQAASNGDKPNQIVTSGLGGVRLRNGQALTIAFMPEGSTIPIEDDVAQRLQELTDVDVGTTTTNPQSQSSSESTTSEASDTTTTSTSSSSPADSTTTSSATSSSSP